MAGGVALGSHFFHLVPANNAQDFLKDWFAPLLFAFYLATMVWCKRSEKNVRPWRTLALFETNPIGAEEMYRITPWTGAFTGLLLGLILSLSTGEKFLLLKFLPWICAILVARVAYRRWIEKKAI
jgi:hypothetical protein